MPDRRNLQMRRSDEIEDSVRTIHGTRQRQAGSRFSRVPRGAFNGAICAFIISLAGCGGSPRIPDPGANCGSQLAIALPPPRSQIPVRATFKPMITSRCAQAAPKRLQSRRRFPPTCGTRCEPMPTTGVMRTGALAPTTTPASRRVLPQQRSFRRSARRRPASAADAR